MKVLLDIVKMSSFKRVLFFFAFLVVFTISYYLGTENKVHKDDAKELLNEFNKIIKEIDHIGIFLHNTTIALPMFIPGIGIIWGLFSSWSTGYAFAALESIKPTLAHIHPLGLLYFTPFGILELTAYSIAMSRSFILSYKIIKNILLISDIKTSLIEVFVVILLLLSGGILEAYMLTLLENGSI